MNKKQIEEKTKKVLEKYRDNFIHIALMMHNELKVIEDDFLKDEEKKRK